MPILFSPVRGGTFVVKNMNGKSSELFLPSIHPFQVFVNGQLAGSHEGGHLPFEIGVTHLLTSGDAGMSNELVVRVDGRLEREHVPPGGGWGAMAPGCYPDASFDFYPFCGIQVAFFPSLVLFFLLGILLSLLIPSFLPWALLRFFSLIPSFP